MSDARPIQPAKPMPGLSTGQVQPAEASRAVATVLRYGWQKAREHLRHCFFWICLSAYLAYAFWQKEPQQPTDLPATHTVMRPTLEPAPLIGHWEYLGTPYTTLEFLADGTVVSRTQRKAAKGKYEVKDNAITTMGFDGEPLFWDVHPLPDYYLVRDDELTLIATRGSGDIAHGQFYQFKRINPANGNAAPATSTSVQ